ncbi:MAG: hypothetical protein U5L75_03485 [Candidatus Campbellbacteria bacterium]|nr:hypothetical protein [Candidatus Campbellbacteria bacterium]
MSKHSLQKGIGLIEVLIATTILTLIVFAFTSSLSLYSSASVDATKRTQATFLAEEGLEVVRMLRDESWSNNIEPQSSDTDYGFSFDTSTSDWSITSGPETFGEFTRTLVFGDVYRDSNDDIVTDGSGTFDPDSRFVTVEVTWDSRRGEQRVVLESLVNNTFDN